MTRDEMAFEIYVKSLRDFDESSTIRMADGAYRLVDIFLACPLRTKLSAASVSPDVEEMSSGPPSPSAATPVPAADNSGAVSFDMWMAENYPDHSYYSFDAMRAVWNARQRDAFKDGSPAAATPVPAADNSGADFSFLSKAYERWYNYAKNYERGLPDAFIAGYLYASRKL